MLGDGVLKSTFYVIIGDGEVSEIINIYVKINWGLTLDEDAGEYTWIMGAGGEASFGHGGAKGVVPMLETAS
jgi:hypothetical protein